MLIVVHAQAERNVLREHRLLSIAHLAKIVALLLGTLVIVHQAHTLWVVFVQLVRQDNGAQLLPHTV